MASIKSSQTEQVIAAAPRATGAARHPAVRRWLGNPVVQRVLSVVVVLAAWQLIGVHFPYSMSSPGAIVSGGRTSLISQVLPAFRETLATFGIGFGICIFAGVPLGLAMARIRLIRIALEPYVLIFYSMPTIALIPVLIILFGVSFQLRVSGVVLFGIFAIIVNTMIGASQIEPALEDVGRSFVASPWKRLTSIIFPGSLRYIFAGIRIGFGHGMIGAVVIELEASALGMGNLLSTFSQELQLGKYFVVVIVLGIFSILCSIVMRAAERWSTEPWLRKHRLPRLRAAGSRLTRPLPAAAARTGGRSGYLSRVDASRGIGRASADAGQLLRRAAVSSAALVRAWLRTRWGPWVVRAVVLAAIIGYWQLAAQSASRAVLPFPGDVVQAAYHLTFVSHEILGPLLTSLELLFAGFALSVVAGIPIGLAMGRIRWFENVADPYVSFLYSLPHVVFVPLFVVWLGFGFNFGLAYVTVSAIFPVIINTMHGVKSIDPEYFATGRSFCASERTVLWRIVIPATTPFMVAGARLAFSVSWIGVIISEVLSSLTGLGGQMNLFSSSYQTADVFVPVLFIAAISVAILEISTRYQPRLTPWFESGG